MGRWFIGYCKFLMVAALLCCSNIDGAHADLILDLMINNPDKIVGPFDTVSYTATLTNEATSTETLFGNTFSQAQCCFDFTPFYAVSFGSLGKFNLAADWKPWFFHRAQASHSIS